MREIEQRIASLVSSHFPSIFREEQTRLVDFLKAYYEWMQSSQQVVGRARKLLSYRDVDSTLEEFYEHFRKKYLENFPNTSSLSTPFLVKNVLDVYKAKGTEDGVKLLIQILYNEESRVYLPGSDVFKPSDGDWVIPRYLELSVTTRTKNYINKEIIGERSGARAFAESLVRRRISGKYIDVLYISNVNGQFVIGEKIVEASNTINTNAPVTVGSLSSIEILDGGQQLAIGDLLSIASDSGKQGVARVTEISSETGIVRFQLYNGGFGFTTTSNVVVSDRVLNISNISNANTLLTGPDPDLDYTLLETVTQAVYRYGVTGSANNSNFVANTVLTTYHGNGAVKATGRVISFTDANSSAGYVKVYPVLSTFSPGETVYFPSNTANVAVANVLNSTATGVVIGSANQGINAASWSIGVANVANEFLATTVAPVIGSTSNTYSYIQSVGAGEGADFVVALLSNEEDVTLNTDRLAANNVGLVPFMNILVDGTNSNSTGYGFPKKASVGYNTGGVILDALTFVNRTVGTIEEIGGINRGQDYTQDPFVLVKEELVYPLDKRDYRLSVANVSGLFVNNEVVEQTFSTPMIVLTVQGFTGNTLPELGESVKQANSTSANATSGVIYRYGTSAGNVVSITVTSVTGQGFVANASYPVIGATSNGYANVSNVSSITTSTSARGFIEFVSNSTLFNVRRLSLANNFVANSTIIGQTSGATATLVDIFVDKATALEADRMNVSGINANVTANVQVANNVATNLEVVVSGFGYVNDETLTLSKTGSPYIVTGKANTYYDGTGAGFFASTKSFASEDKFIHDNFYYQEYSYEIQTKVPFNKYEPVLKKVMHVAGTQAFGKVVSASAADATIQEESRNGSTVTLSLNQTNTYFHSNTIVLAVGSTAYQSNNTANVFVGTVVSPLLVEASTYPKENQLANGVVVYYPNITDWEVRGVVSKMMVNSTSNTTTVFISNTTGVFPNNVHLQYIDPTDGSPRTVWAYKAINTVQLETTSGHANTSQPLRFANQQADVVHVTYGLD